MKITRVHVVLFLLIILSALMIVTAQNRARSLFAELEHERFYTQQLEAEWGQLQAEQQTWSAHNAIAKVAKERWHMQEPSAEQLIILEGRGAAMNAKATVQSPNSLQKGGVR